MQNSINFYGEIMKQESFPTILGKPSFTRVKKTNPKQIGWYFDKKAGLWKKTTVGKNSVVNAGIVMMLSSIQAGHTNAGKTLNYIGVGTSSTDPAITDTALGTEVERIAILSWDNTNLATNPHVMIASTQFAIDEAVGNLAEIALFQEATGAPMFSRGLFGKGDVTTATNASPIVIGSTAHGIATVEYVLFEGVDGMTALNGNMYWAKRLTDNTFELYSDEACTIAIDGTDSIYGELDSANNGTWKIIVPKANGEIGIVNYSLSMTAV
jgi:hypothetical protein